MLRFHVFSIPPHLTKRIIAVLWRWIAVLCSLQAYRQLSTHLFPS